LTGSHTLAAKIMVAALLMSIALNIILIPRYGPVGAAIASATTLLFWNIAVLISAKRRTGVLSWPLARSLR
jgi:O-antigen/teichoic acid export membrane protein